MGLRDLWVMLHAGNRVDDLHLLSGEEITGAFVVDRLQSDLLAFDEKSFDGGRGAVDLGYYDLTGFGMLIIATDDVITILQTIYIISHDLQYADLIALRDKNFS